MRDTKRLTKVIKDAVAAEFDKGRILDVRIGEETYFDDDDILRVEILFEGTERDIDVRNIANLTEKIRKKLLERVNETAFPVISFISRSDFGVDRFAAA
jgi:hypothetical protein